jgi:rhodanese-related sulfurtransferase
MLTALTTQPKPFTEIDAATFQQKMKEPNVVVLDVRSSNEVAMGFIKGTQLFLDAAEDDFEQKIEKLDKSKVYLVYCRIGNKSAMACSIMSKKGFHQLFVLSGGIKSYTGELEKK